MIQLEVGKSYRVRNPSKVKEEGFSDIVKIEIQYNFGFCVGNDGFGYNTDGRCPYVDDCFDLIEEVKP